MIINKLFGRSQPETKPSNGFTDDETGRGLAERISDSEKQNRLKGIGRRIGTIAVASVMVPASLLGLQTGNEADRLEVTPSKGVPGAVVELPGSETMTVNPAPVERTLELIPTITTEKPQDATPDLSSLFEGVDFNAINSDNQLSGGK